MASIEWWRSLCPGVVDEWSSASWEPTGLDRAGRRQCRVKRSSIFTVPVLPGRLPRRVGRRARELRPRGRDARDAHDR